MRSLILLTLFTLAYSSYYLPYNECTVFDVSTIYSYRLKIVSNNIITIKWDVNAKITKNETNDDMVLIVFSTYDDGDIKICNYNSYRAIEFDYELSDTNSLLISSTIIIIIFTVIILSAFLIVRYNIETTKKENILLTDNYIHPPIEYLEDVSPSKVV